MLHAKTPTYKCKNRGKTEGERTQKYKNMQIKCKYKYSISGQRYTMKDIHTLTNNTPNKMLMHTHSHTHSRV